jgi:hypothetical protein
MFCHTWVCRYPFEVPEVTIIEGAEIFPPGSLVDGTSPPVLVSPADSEVWTPSHSCGTLAMTVQTYLRSGLPWPQPRTPVANASASAPKAIAPNPTSPPQSAAAEPLSPSRKLSVGEVVVLAVLRDSLGDSFYPCKPVRVLIIYYLRFLELFFLDTSRHL